MQGGGGKFAVLALLGGGGLWAANEYGYIDFQKAKGNLPLPVLVRRGGGPRVQGG